jgi:S-adenosylhomocysteine hydrolase
MADNKYGDGGRLSYRFRRAQGSFVGKEVLLLGFGALGQEFLKRLMKGESESQVTIRMKSAGRLWAGVAPPSFGKQEDIAAV